MSKLKHSQDFTASAVKPTALVQIVEPDFTETWEYKMQHNEQGLLVDLIQTISSDRNKWQQKNIVTDKILYRYLFTQALLDLGVDAIKVGAYIQKKFTLANFDREEGFDLQALKDLAQKTQTVQVSLPTGYYLPTEPRKFVDTFLPLHVIVDNYNYSSAFADYDQADPNRVDQAFNSLLNGEVPAVNNEVTRIW